MKEIYFEYTWCDYLTKCPYKSNIEVGSFDCHCCKYNEGLILDKKEDEVNLMKISDKLYYKKRYGSVYTGICKCNHK